MKVSDYVMQFIASLGVKDIFYVSGGGAMHLDDSLGSNPSLQGICALHEQGASIEAEAYARITENYGVCLVTSGPGSTNALTGLSGAYLDSTPVIFLSGQVKRDDLVGDQGIRQFGIQEVDIVSMVASSTKYAVIIMDAKDVRYELEKAAYLAKEGRPGPVWIDIPLDIQASEIDETSLRGYEHQEMIRPSCEEKDIEETIQLLNASKRPLILVGNGIRLSGAKKEMRTLLETLKIPVMTSWNGCDLVEEDFPMYCGRPGIVANRYTNFIFQNADFVLTIGTRLNLLSTGYNYDSFLENATHVMVDIDEHEMDKKSVHPDKKIVCDAKVFIEKMLEHSDRMSIMDRHEWEERIAFLKTKYPRFIPEQVAQKDYVSNYRLIDEVTKQMSSDDIYQFTSSGTTVDIAMKMIQIKKDQRAFLTKGLASMGFDIPASIGSCIASGGRRTVCVTGDGSAVMNMQELEIAYRYQLPIKIFVADNQGYAMIYGSQNGNFKGRLTGCTKESGLTLPDMGKIAEAMGIISFHIEEESQISDMVRQVLEYDGPVVCTYHADITQQVLPRQANYMKENGQMASRPLNDMAPLLEREELEDVMSW